MGLNNHVMLNGFNDSVITNRSKLFCGSARIYVTVIDHSVITTGCLLHFVCLYLFLFLSFGLCVCVCVLLSGIMVQFWGRTPSFGQNPKWLDG